MDGIITVSEYLATNPDHPQPMTVLALERLGAEGARAHRAAVRVILKPMGFRMLDRLMREAPRPGRGGLREERVG